MVVAATVSTAFSMFNNGEVMVVASDSGKSDKSGGDILVGGGDRCDNGVHINIYIYYNRFTSGIIPDLHELDRPPAEASLCQAQYVTVGLRVPNAIESLE